MCTFPDLWPAFRCFSMTVCDLWKLPKTVTGIVLVHNAYTLSYAFYQAVIFRLFFQVFSKDPLDAQKKIRGPILPSLGSLGGVWVTQTRWLRSILQGGSVQTFTSGPGGVRPPKTFWCTLKCKNTFRGIKHTQTAKNGNSRKTRVTFTRLSITLGCNFCVENILSSIGGLNPQAPVHRLCADSKGKFM